MVFLLCEKYKPFEPTIRFRLVQAIFDLIGIIFSFCLFAIVHSFIVNIFVRSKKKFFKYKKIIFIQKPRISYVTCDMSDFTYPYIVSTMPVYAVALFVFLANFILIGLVEAYNAKLLFCKSDGRSFDELRTFSIMTYHSISLFTYGFGLNLLVTEIIKRLSGRLKPRMLN